MTIQAQELPDSLAGVQTDELHVAGDDRNAIGNALIHLLMRAPCLTDIVIHEGAPIMVKSALGTLPASQVVNSIPEFKVTRQHLIEYVAGYVGGEGRHDPSTYWKEGIEPQLKRGASVNMRLDGLGDHSLRYTLFNHGGEGQLGMVMRVTPKKVKPLASLQLPPALLSQIGEATSGLIIVTGPTASGKTATGLSILDNHNQKHSGHILTIEDPIETKLVSARSIITQREVGTDVPSFAHGMREALRMSPDVMLVSEIRDQETAEQTILGGESGALMIATTHGRSCTGTLRKLLSYTGANAPALRSVLAGSLIAVVRQALVPNKEGTAYEMVADVLFNQGKTTDFIERGDLQGLEQLIAEERMGSVEFSSMNQRLAGLIRNNVVDGAKAMRETSNPAGLKTKLGGR